MSEFIFHLEVVILLLVIIWLVASIRQSLLNTPGPMSHVKRFVRRTSEMRTSRENPPQDTNLAPLDSIHPDDALAAVEKYFEENKK